MKQKHTADSLQVSYSEPVIGIGLLKSSDKYVIFMFSLRSAQGVPGIW